MTHEDSTSTTKPVRPTGEASAGAGANQADGPAMGARRAPRSVQGASETVGRGRKGLGEGGPGNFGRAGTGSLGAREPEDAKAATNPTDRVTSEAGGANLRAAARAAQGAGDESPESEKDALRGAARSIGVNAIGPSARIGKVTGSAGSVGGTGVNKRRAALAATAASAQPIAQLLLLAALLNWLKSLFFTFAAVAMNVGRLLLMALTKVVKSVAGFFGSIGSAVSGFVGGAISAPVAAGVAGIASLALGASLLSAVLGSLDDTTVLDGELADKRCVTGSSRATNALAVLPGAAAGDGMYRVTPNNKPRGSQYHGDVYHIANSPLGVAKAVKAGAGQIDNDLQLTKDGVLIVNHWHDVQRREKFRADGIPTSKLIHQLTWSQVSQLRAPDGGRIHALSEMMPLYAANGITANLDLKGSPGEGYRVATDQVMSAIANMANQAGAHVTVKAEALPDDKQGRLLAGMRLASQHGFWTRQDRTSIWIPPAVTVSGVSTGVGAPASTSGIATSLSTPATCCPTTASSSAVSSALDSTAAATGQTLANAKTIYSVLAGAGMPKENIAGILGNWSRESGIDPTGVEGIYDEPFNMGPKKTAAQTANWTGYGRVQYRGIGLGQWTNGRNQLLMAYARSTNKPWYDLATQLKFMLAGDNPGDVAVVKQMLTTPQGTPGQAAVFFHEKWERSADSAAKIAARKAEAEKWFGQMSAWTVDQTVAGTLAGSLIDQTAGGLTSAITVGLANNCRTPAGATTTFAGLQSGGLTTTQAQQVVDIYLQEGDAWLDARYGDQGGPGSCGSDHAENCVSFSVYFLGKYTSEQRYPSGDGARTAYSLASMIGRAVSTTPTVYSIFSKGAAQGDSVGHTGVVLGIDGDTLIIGEAHYCNGRGNIRLVPATTWRSEGWVFTDVSHLITSGLAA